MKPAISILYRLGLIAVVGLLLAGRLSAQYKITTVLHNFGDGSTYDDQQKTSLPSPTQNFGGYPEGDGYGPTAALVQGRDGNFYGTTATGGVNGEGMVFVTTPTGQTSDIYDFGYGGNDGIAPEGALIQGGTGDNNFYGTTSSGGQYGDGIIFSISYFLTGDGEGYVAILNILHNFGDPTVLDVNGNSVADGRYPSAGLLIGKDGNFYGTTAGGGAHGAGTAFVMTPQGTVTILHSFGDPTVTNDGTNPSAPLIQGIGSDNNFYGVTQSGGVANGGTLFQMTSQGAITILHSFTGASLGKNAYDFETGAYVYDGMNPVGVVDIPNMGLAGTTTNGGYYGGNSSGSGAVFGYTSTGYHILHLFLGPPTGASQPKYDGANPKSGLCVDSSGNLYGTTYGGEAGQYVNQSAGNALQQGSIYQLKNASGTYIYSVIQSDYFLNADGTTNTLPGENPSSGLIIGADGNFYGTTFDGGTASNSVATAGFGTIYKLNLFTPALSPTESLYGVVGNSVLFNLVTINSAAQFAAQGLPTGFSIDPSTGKISGLPTKAASGDATITLTNAAGYNTLLLPYTIISNVLAEGSQFSVVLNPGATTSGFPPDYWTISPLPLPAGLIFSNSTGDLSGTPTVPGNYNFTITASYTDGGTQAPTPRATQTYSFGVSENFQTWANSFANASQASIPNGTPQKDGVPNLLKFLCHIDPSHPMSATDRAALPTMGIDSTSTNGVQYLELTYRQFALESGVGVQLQTSSDLKTWTPVTSPDINQQLNPGTTGDPIMEMGVILSPGTPTKFIRMGVSQ